jgi:hypothetical protein
MIFIYGEKYFFMEFGEYTTIFMYKCLGPIFFMETPPGSGFLARNRPFLWNRLRRWAAGPGEEGCGKRRWDRPAGPVMRRCSCGGRDDVVMPLRSRDAVW